METRPSEAVWSLPCEPGSAGVARGLVGDVCSQLEREVREVAVLLTSELVGNAVEHGRGDVRLVVNLGPSLVRVEVHDQSPVTPSPQAASRVAPRGRGLMLVERLSSRWGVQSSPGAGKYVWFELRVTR